MLVGIVKKIQAALNLLLYLGPIVRVHAIPFVDRNHQGTACIQNKTNQMQVLIHQPFPGVDNQDDHMGIVDGLKGFNDGELLHHFTDVFAPAHTRCIDQRVLVIHAFERDINAVSGGTGHVIDNHPVFPEHTINQCRLAHVRPPDDTDAYAWIAISTILRFPLLLGRQQLFQHGANAPVMGSRYQIGGLETQTVEIGRGNIGVLAIGFIDHQVCPLASLAQMGSDQFIAAIEPGLAIYQKQHDVCFLDSLHGLARHFGVQAFFVPGQATGINHDKALPFVIALTVFTIARQTGKVRYKRIPGPCHLVKQCRFPHVGAPDKSNYRGHSLSLHIKQGPRFTAIGPERSTQSSVRSFNTDSLPLLPYTRRLPFWRR